MTFSDIFKKSFLEGFSSTDINVYTATTAMLVTCALALYIFVVYRVLTKKTFYSKSFNIALAGIALIKDPMDLMFLFWSIAIGIICGVGMAEIAIILSILMTVGILVLNGLPVAKAPMILVVNASDLDAEETILAAVGKYAKHNTVKSRNMTKSSLDLIIELRTGEGSKLVREVLAIDCVCSASLMNHDGEVTF